MRIREGGKERERQKQRQFQRQTTNLKVNSKKGMWASPKNSELNSIVKLFTLGLFQVVSAFTLNT